MVAKPGNLDGVAPRALSVADKPPREDNIERAIAVDRVPSDTLSRHGQSRRSVTCKHSSDVYPNSFIVREGNRNAHCYGNFVDILSPPRGGRKVGKGRQSVGS